MVIDGSEEPTPAVPPGIEPGAIRAPHLVRTVGHNLAVVGRVAIRGTEAAGRQQPVCSHQPQHALAAHRIAAMGQPCPHLAITLAMERARGQDRADLLDELSVPRSPSWARASPTLAGSCR